jgi:4-hydroxythreonine-4-phosphate dehydrogenase
MIKKPVIGLMLGDVTGIGPEVAVRLLERIKNHQSTRVVIVGDLRVLQVGMKDSGITIDFHLAKDVDAIDWTKTGFPMIDLQNVDPATIVRGATSIESGRLCGETLKVMTDWAHAGKLDAICFAPLNKGALNKGGWKYRDEHEMFATWNHHQGYYGEVNLIKLFCINFKLR